MPLTQEQVTALSNSLISFSTSLNAVANAMLATVVTVPTPVPSAKPIFTLKRTFRLPRTVSNGVSFEFGGGPLALDPATHTLFATSRSGQVAELSIPGAGVEFCGYLQGFADPSEGAILNTLGQRNSDGSITPLAGLTGLVVTPTGLTGNALIYYDANGNQQVSHFNRPRDLSSRGLTSPLYSVGAPGLTAGYMTNIPTAWQSRLKGTVLTGTFGSPIVSRGSLGPTAFSFTPGAPGPTQVTPLVYYPSTHPTLGTYALGPANPVYNMTAKGDGAVIVKDTLVVFGISGIGVQKYGSGTGDPTLDGKPTGEGSDVWCYDPVNSAKGTHAYPYRYQTWSYPLADLEKVANGFLQPWALVPDVAVLPLPTPEQTFTGLGGAVYDESVGSVYVSQLRADVDGYAYRPIITEFSVS